MPADYAAAASLAADLAWQARIKAAITFKAVEIGNAIIAAGAITDQDTKLRMVLCRNILRDPESFVDAWSYLVAVQGVVLTDTDDDINFQLDGMWDLVAGVGG